MEIHGIVERKRDRERKQWKDKTSVCKQKQRKAQTDILAFNYQ